MIRPGNIIPSSMQVRQIRPFPPKWSSNLTTRQQTNSLWPRPRDTIRDLLCQLGPMWWTLWPQNRPVDKKYKHFSSLLQQCVVKGEWPLGIPPQLWPVTLTRSEMWPCTKQLQFSPPHLPTAAQHSATQPRFLRHPQPECSQFNLQIRGWSLGNLQI